MFGKHYIGAYFNIEFSYFILRPLVKSEEIWNLLVYCFLNMLSDYDYCNNTSFDIAKNRIVHQLFQCLKSMTLQSGPLLYNICPVSDIYSYISGPVFTNGLSQGLGLKLRLLSQVSAQNLLRLLS